jgi:glycosyltransferase involved in cell wall biosynthesis
MGTDDLLVVAACFNEESLICQFMDSVLQLQQVDRLVLIDDGSRDATVAVIRQWQRDHAEAPVTLLELTRNFGKEAAMLAGLDYANRRCAAAILIDSDLQHPPERIPVMVAAWRDGAEVVTAVRDDRDEESRMKVATASWFYRVFNRLVDSIQLQEGAGDFRLLSAPVVEAVTQMREATRFSKGLMPWTGYRSVEIPYSRVARAGGSSSWSSLKLWRYALDGIFSFSVKPLKVWGVIGVLISCLSFLYAALIVLRTLVFGIDLPGYASLIVAVLFLGGIQLIGIGVLGEYIGRIYIDVKRRPHYFIRAVHGSGGSAIPFVGLKS